VRSRSTQALGSTVSPVHESEAWTLPRTPFVSISVFRRRSPFAENLPCFPHGVPRPTNATSTQLRCSLHPQHTVVPGWLYFASRGIFPYERFTAHSVVRIADGSLLDITPSEFAMPYPFLPAEESQTEYDQLVETQRVMYLHYFPAEFRVEAYGTLQVPQGFD
jgi:hypothetical protein